MKLFNINNPRHVEILKEELTRAKSILREYNEADIWKRLSIPIRQQLLRNVDIEMGKDFATEYANTDWLKIPDAVTNRIDISNYSDDFIKSISKRASMFARGIFEIIYDNTRYRNTIQLQNYIAKTIGATSTQPDAIKTALMQYAQNNPDAMQDLNIKIQRMSVSKMPIGTTTSIGGTKPSSNPNYAGGSSWTGD
jgi:hypothetical protein